MFGVLAVDKPAGWTSRDVVNKVTGLVRPAKAGHTGTLDPMATGVLLVAIGSATRLTEFSHFQDKAYRGTFRLGCRSDTLDIEGRVEELPTAKQPSLDDLQRCAATWVGQVEQTPPKYSAIHIDGKRAHELARKGRDFEVPSRSVNIASVEVSDYDYPNFTLSIVCGTGTYVRSLGSDIARAFESDAIMTSLVRTRVGEVGLAQCATLTDLRSGDCVRERLMRPNLLVASLPSVVLSREECERIRNGIPLTLDRNESLLAATDQAGDLVAVLEPNGQVYRSRRVFHKTPATAQPSSISTPQSPES